MNSFLQIHPEDNALVALQNLPKNKTIQFKNDTFALQNDIEAKHKFATTDLNIGDAVKMYGVLVGKAMQFIPQGGLIGTHNLVHAAQNFGVRQTEYHWNASDGSKFKNRTFKGFHRADGQVGARNYWLVVPLVFCENRDILTLKDAFLKELGYAQPDIHRQQLRHLSDYFKKYGTTDGFVFSDAADNFKENRLFKNVDGIKFLTHESGCGGTRDDANRLCALMQGMRKIRAWQV